MKFPPRAAILTCLLMAAMFFEMSAFFFLYRSCPACLLSITFILTYWVCSSAINMMLGFSFIVLTGEMSPEKKWRVAVISAVALFAMLVLVGYAIRINFA